MDHAVFGTEVHENDDIFFCIFFGGLECVGHSLAYVAHLWFLRDIWIRTQSDAVASWRATDLATHPSDLATHPDRLSHPWYLPLA